MSLAMRQGGAHVPATEWKVLSIDGQGYYINTQFGIATTEPPTGKKKYKRTSKVSKESGTYIVQPAPKGLPAEWEQAIALNPDSTSGSFVWHNVSTGETSKEDPRAVQLCRLLSNGLLLISIDSDDPLPAGWTMSFDDEGDVFFIDHNSGITTYDDPRLICTEVVDLSAERIAEQLTEDRLKTEFARGQADSPAAWKIATVRHSEFNDLPQNLTTKAKLPSSVVGKALNRYINILPNPRTRVVIDDAYEPKTEISTYINANFIAGYSSQPREYIAAMGPLDNTIESFWRMVWMVRSPAIVMTTPMMEQGRVKCARYWPTVRYNEAKKCGDKVWGEISVAVLKGEKRDGYVLTHLRIRRGTEEQQLRHYWYQDWPDHGVPSAAGATQVIEMMKEVREHCEAVQGGPPIVHCSAGIGRTGTFIAIDQAVRCLQERGQVDCLDIIQGLRQHRGGMVQHPQQYEFVVKACIQYARMNSHGYVLWDRKENTTKEDPNHPKPSPSSPKGSVKNWKSTAKSKNLQVLAEFIAKGKPADMPDVEWQKLKRKYQKQQASIRAARSTKRNIDEAEMHGELRLGTLSGGTSDGRYRPGVQHVFVDKQ